MLNGARLKEERKKKGLTQTQLGELIGVGKSAICFYENETRNPTIEALIELMHVFGVSADYLLGSDYLVKSKEMNEFVELTREEIIFITEIKKNKMVYEILMENPKRGAELVKKWLN